MASDASRGKRPAGGNQDLLSTLPKKLPLDFLKEITNGFSDDRVLSQGAFGTVYKGILQDGQEISVKKVAENSRIPHAKEFYKNAGDLMAIRHENIVKLISFCHEDLQKVVNHNGKYILVDTAESLLCYEYVPKGSLRNNLFADQAHGIEWCTRFKIIKGICQGLHFLHVETGKAIVHLDLQPDNILLDDDMVPKIADFGFSRLFGEEQTRIQTINVVGAIGYMAPEYLYRGEISPQCDIYSLGLLILEITTGEKNCCSNKDMSSMKYIDNVRQTWTDEHIASKYSSLEPDCLQQVKTCIETGLKCMNVDQKKRPSIVEIVGKLNGRHTG